MTNQKNDARQAVFGKMWAHATPDGPCHEDECTEERCTMDAALTALEQKVAADAVKETLAAIDYEACNDDLREVFDKFKARAAE